MKKRLQITALLLIAVLLLGGCTGVGSNEKTNIQYLPEKVDAPEGIPVLQWVCLTERGFSSETGRIWSEEAALAVNEMLAERDMPFRIQFVMMTRSSDHQDYLWTTLPAARKALKSADLIYGCMDPDAMKQYLAPITTYAAGETSPGLENAVIHPKSWTCATVDGEIYGIPTLATRACSNGWAVDASILERHPEAEFAREFWEMDDVFARIYEENGHKPFLGIRWDTALSSDNPALGVQNYWMPVATDDILSYVWQYICTCFAIDYSGKKPTVVNYLETERMRLVQEAVVRYSSAGYVTTTESNLPHSTPVQYVPIDGGIAYNDGEKQYIPVTPAMYNEVKPYTFFSGVAASSAHKEEALSLLNLIAEDEQFRTKLFYGKEGRDYIVNDDGYYKLVTRDDGSNYSLSMLSPLSCFSGLTSSKNDPDTYLLSTGTYNEDDPAAEGMDVRQTLHAGLEESILCCPIIFDFSGYEKNIKAMEDIFMNYFMVFSRLTPEKYDQMLSELRAQHSEEIRASMQAQLDAWLEAHPEWEWKP